MPGLNQIVFPTPSDSQSSGSKIQSFKKASKRVVLAMRFLNVNSHSENELSIDRPANECPDMQVLIPAYFLVLQPKNASAFFCIILCLQAGSLRLMKDFTSHPKHNYYLQGLTLEEAQDFSQAKDMYELAREGPTQHPSACARLWDFYQFGRPGIIRNFERAFSCARSGARSLCVHCSGALSLHMAFGWGMSEHDLSSGSEKIDEFEALRLAKASSQHGSPYGHYALATFYFGGIIVAKNDKEMFSLYLKAAEQGLGRAKLALGACYKDGIGVQVNPRLAAKHLEAASVLGVEGAAFLLQSLSDQNNRLDN